MSRVFEMKNTPVAVPVRCLREMVGLCVPRATRSKVFFFVSCLPAPSSFFTAQEWSWHTLAESKSAQPTRAVW